MCRDNRSNLMSVAKTSFNKDVLSLCTKPPPTPHSAPQEQTRCQTKQWVSWNGLKWRESDCVCGFSLCSLEITSLSFQEYISPDPLNLLLLFCSSSLHSSHPVPSSLNQSLISWPDRWTLLCWIFLYCSRSLLPLPSINPFNELTSLSYRQQRLKADWVMVTALSKIRSGHKSGWQER